MEILSPRISRSPPNWEWLRKELAAEDGVALYNVLTNEQLVHILQRRTRTLEQLREISGIGRACIDKYGVRFFELLNKTKEGTDEPGGRSARYSTTRGPTLAQESPAPWRYES